MSAASESRDHEDAVACVICGRDDGEGDVDDTAFGHALCYRCDEVMREQLDATVERLVADPELRALLLARAAEIDAALARAEARYEAERSAP